MNHIFDDNGHLTQVAFDKLQTNTLTEIELISSASHLADCEYCANAFADSFTVHQLAEVPSGFTEEIEKKLYAKRKNNKQFIFYSIRVAIAVCAALVIIFSGTLNFISDVVIKGDGLKAPQLNFVNSVNTELQNFSQKILDMEVFLNETEKK